MAGSHVPKRHHHHYGTGTHKHVRHSSTPGPQGRNDAAHPGFGPVMSGDTPGPLGTGGDWASPHRKAQVYLEKTPVLLLNAKKIIAFVRSVAYAKAQQQKTKLRWEEDKSKFMRGLYTVMFWKGAPGTAEVDTGDWRQIDKTAAADTGHMMRVVMKKAGESPKALTEYLKGLEEIRAYSLEAVKDVYKDANEINHEVREAAAAGIKRLAVIKFSSDLIVAVLGIVTGGKGLSFAVPFIYSMGGAFIETMDDAPTAKVVAFTDVGLSKTTEHALHHQAEHYAEHMAGAAEEQELQAELSREEADLWRELISKQKRAILEGNFTRAEAEKLYQQIGKEAQRGLGMQISAQAAEEQAARLARLRMAGKAFGGAVQIAFLAKEVHESWHHMLETFEKADQGAE